MLECCVLRGVGWLVSPLAIVLGFYTSGEESLVGSSNLSLILASARMVFPLLDVESDWNILEQALHLLSKNIQLG